MRAQRALERAAQKEAARAQAARDLMRAAMGGAAADGHDEVERQREAMLADRASRDAATTDDAHAAPARSTSRTRATAAIAHASHAHAGERCQTPTRSEQTENLSPNRASFSDSSRVSSADAAESSDAGDIRWVMENLHRGDEVVAGDAPSLTAWGLLSWARSSAKAYDAFVTQVYGKAFVSKDAEDLKRRDRRSQTGVTAMIERCIEASVRAQGGLKDGA